MLESEVERVHEAIASRLLEPVLPAEQALLVLAFLPWVADVVEAAARFPGGPLPDSLERVLGNSTVSREMLEQAFGLPSRGKKTMPVSAVRGAVVLGRQGLRWHTRPALEALREPWQALADEKGKYLWAYLDDWQSSAERIQEELSAFWARHPDVLEFYRARAIHTVTTAATRPRHAEYLERGGHRNEAYLDDHGLYGVLHGDAAGGPHRLATLFIPYPRTTSEALRLEVTCTQAAIRQCAEAPGATGVLFKAHARYVGKRAVEAAMLHSPHAWGV